MIRKKIHDKHKIRKIEEPLHHLPQISYKKGTWISNSKLFVISNFPWPRIYELYLRRSHGIFSIFTNVYKLLINYSYVSIHNPIYPIIHIYISW